MRCPFKHTKYQPEDNKPYICPNCGSWEFFVQDSPTDEVTGLECTKLHEDDYIVCEKCGYSITGKIFSSKIMKEKNLIICPTCKGKGCISKDKYKGELIDKVIVLTAGEYEDKHIVGVFSSMEKVNQIKEMFPNEDYNEPIIYDIDNDDFPDIPKDKDIYYVSKFSKGWKSEDIVRNYGVLKEGKTVYNATLVRKIYYNIHNMPYTFIIASSKEEAVDEFEKLLEDKK